MDLTALNELKQDQNGLGEFSSNSKLNAPPVPQRTQPVLNSSIAPFVSNYAQNLGTNPYYAGGGGMYNSTGAYYSGFGFGSASSYGANAATNSFMRSAEESSRGAFQSIESVVQAFSAVAAMFESTYYAVYNSFRAVVGVADQFYRLKTHLQGILSALALVRMLKFLYKRCLKLLGLRKEAITEQEIWSSLSDAERFVKSQQNKSEKKTTNWPLIMFFAVVLGGPWLIWKILSSIDSASKDDGLWMSGKIDHFIAVSEYDFDSINADELSFKRGQRVLIAPKEYQPKLRGWLLGTVDGKTMGIMPANYLKILGKKIGDSNNKNEDSNDHK